MEIYLYLKQQCCTVNPASFFFFNTKAINLLFKTHYSEAGSKLLIQWEKLPKWAYNSIGEFSILWNCKAGAHWDWLDIVTREPFYFHEKDKT